MEQHTFAIEPGKFSWPQLNVQFDAFTIIETGPNGYEVRHWMNEAGDPFRTDAEAQLWILNRKV